MIRRSLPLLAVAVLRCSHGASAQARTPPGADTAAAARVDLRRIVDRPVVVYVQATTAELESLRDRTSEAEFAVVADDLMYYRAAANEYLDSKRVPVVRIEGRRPIVFRVDGTPRRYDFADVELLDFVIVYDGKAEPRILAPNEIETVAGPLPARPRAGP